MRYSCSYTHKFLHGVYAGYCHKEHFPGISAVLPRRQNFFNVIFDLVEKQHPEVGWFEIYTTVITLKGYKIAAFYKWPSSLGYPCDGEVQPFEADYFLNLANGASLTDVTVGVSWYYDKFSASEFHRNSDQLITLPYLPI
jgi:hypothetical protein